MTEHDNNFILSQKRGLKKRIIIILVCGEMSCVGTFTCCTCIQQYRAVQKGMLYLQVQGVQPTSFQDIHILSWADIDVRDNPPPLRNGKVQVISFGNTTYTINRKMNKSLHTCRMCKNAYRNCRETPKAVHWYVYTVSQLLNKLKPYRTLYIVPTHKYIARKG